MYLETFETLPPQDVFPLSDKPAQQQQQQFDYIERNSPASITVFAKTLTGKTYTVRVFPYASIKRVKEILCHVSGIPTEQQILIYSGSQLTDEDRLCAIGVGPDSTLHLVLNIRGC